MDGRRRRREGPSGPYGAGPAERVRHIPYGRERPRPRTGKTVARTVAGDRLPVRHGVEDRAGRVRGVVLIGIAKHTSGIARESARNAPGQIDGNGHG